MDWGNQNLLGIYGSIVGTVALFLNFGRFWIMWQKSTRKLKVKSKTDSRAQDRLDELRHTDEVLRNRGGLVGPIYDVSVINVSQVSMHVDDAGLLIKDGNNIVELPAHVRNKIGNLGFLSRIEDAGGEDIAPGAKKTFPIWLENPPEIPKVVGCYTVCQMGKKFKGKHYNNRQCLNVPEISTLKSKT